MRIRVAKDARTLQYSSRILQNRRLGRAIFVGLPLRSGFRYNRTVYGT